MLLLVVNGLVVHIGNLSRVDNHTERPVQILVDWNKDEFLLEDVDSFFGGPGCNATASGPS